jgi:hypothetical protein
VTAADLKISKTTPCKVAAAAMPKRQLDVSGKSAALLHHPEISSRHSKLRSQRACDQRFGLELVKLEAAHLHNRRH